MSDNIILSIHPEYAQLIDNGEKTFEIRTRCLHIEKGTRIWIYRTLPEACITSCVEVANILTISPIDAWQNYSLQMCIDQTKYNKYVEGKNNIYLLQLKNVKKLKRKITLGELREKIPPFFPPQFFKKLKKDEEIFQALIELL